ncbi:MULTISPECIES: hypothetical protein [Pseudanabaena]|uniref:Uncharacterized protein n=2 Tax=Pseudanabaena TaxID=1152 RepID=L8MYV2_9CYAN|nr:MULTISPECIES: hypothetical protein [Pseudanabaena]ELS32681.1 hypothetical protein Pse7429DRAFT_2165 [Pseudanabaena biceps PCC 7429]MDG3495106.1 hypothetical protein [Pseudanabaena catenata USMAC16]TYQ24300.1 hypothetical protein PseudUWO310_20930 [Pseudanabaena sp. UWO310]
MILTSLNETRAIEVKTSSGIERGIVFLEKAFVADKLYNTLDAAIVASRKALDSGVAILIAPDGEQFCLWVSVKSPRIGKTVQSVKSA